MSRLFGIRGRLNRLPYVVATLVLFALPFAALAVVIGFGVPDEQAFYPLAIPTLTFFIVSFFLTTRRLHDHDKTAWWMVLYFVVPGLFENLANSSSSTAIACTFRAFAAAVSLWVFIELWFLKGTVGPNRFGDDPLGTPAATSV